MACCWPGLTLEVSSQARQALQRLVLSSELELLMPQSVQVSLFGSEIFLVTRTDEESLSLTAFGFETLSSDSQSQSRSFHQLSRVSWTLKRVCSAMRIE